LVSDSIHDQVRNQLAFDFVDLGKFKLKNVGRPFSIYAIAVDGYSGVVAGSPAPRSADPVEKGCVATGYQPGGGHHCLERVADAVDEEVIPETLTLREAVRVEDHGDALGFDGGPDWSEARIVEQGSE